MCVLLFLCVARGSVCVWSLQHSVMQSTPSFYYYVCAECAEYAQVKPCIKAVERVVNSNLEGKCVCVCSHTYKYARLSECMCMYVCISFEVFFFILLYQYLVCACMFGWHSPRKLHSMLYKQP